MEADAQAAFERLIWRTYDRAAELFLQSPQEARGLAHAVSYALEEAHRARLTFRDTRINDLKPSAILLRRR